MQCQRCLVIISVSSNHDYDYIGEKLTVIKYHGFCVYSILTTYVLSLIFTTLFIKISNYIIYLYIYCGIKSIIHVYFLLLSSYIYLHLYIYIYIYIGVLFGPVKPELGVIPSG